MRRFTAFLVAAAVTAAPAVANATTPAPTETARVHLHDNPLGAIRAYGSIWALSSFNTAWLARIDPATNRVTGTVFLGYGELGGNDFALRPIAAAAGSLWVSRYFRNDVVRVNPQLLTITNRIVVGRSPSDVAAIGGAVFVADSQQSAITRIDPATNRVAATIKVGTQHSFVGGPYRLKPYDHLLWATVPATKRLVAIEPRTNRIVHNYSIGPAIGCGELLPAPHGFWMNDVVCSPSVFRVFRFSTQAHRVTATYTAPADGCFYGATVFRGHLITEEGPLDADQVCTQASFVQRDIDTGAEQQRTALLDAYSYNVETLDGALWAIDDRNDLVRFDYPGSRA